MKIFLLRHGMTARADNDLDRRLTDDGIAVLKEVVGRQISEMTNVSQIHSGPMGRIQQTATIAGEVIAYKGELTVNESLTKLTRGEEIVATLESVDLSDGDVLLVSHESSLCNLLTYLTNEDILMSNSSLTAIEVESLNKGEGKLLWQESPNSREIKRTSFFVDQF